VGETRDGDELAGFDFQTAKKLDPQDEKRARVSARIFFGAGYAVFLFFPSA
jgi:hypothetical protein